MPEATLHALLVGELKVVRKFGLHRLAEHVHELPTLSRLALDIYGVGAADRIEKLLHEAWTKRAEGAQATAVGIILGLEMGRRGARPAVLREVAATRLGYASVDTFRKKPEGQAIAYFADVIESFCIDYQPEATNDEYRINTALNAVMALTLAEYTEFAARLARRFAAYKANPPPPMGAVRTDRVTSQRSQSP
ncbi:hypothetical protein [Rathayibacter sp. SD072]|uniref:hypothetical protein n=1 Tax=Rathayibacter sp. SD072 TaxID=2781731 RepID=UPI001A95AE15|nr:hypothetical protein [Rathayibacter sp. SD072]MBO0983657.1 hypothetical protein [Rathayibacter sp. SD072]